MLGKSVMSEAAFFGGWGRFARPSIAVGVLPCAAWSGGGPGGCTSLFDAVKAGSVGKGTDRALASVWRTCPPWNCGLIRTPEDEDEDDSDDVDATGIGPDSVRRRLVTSWDASSRDSSGRGKNRGGLRFHPASAARAACRRPGVRGVGGSRCTRPLAFEWSFAVRILVVGGVRGDGGAYGSARLAALEKRSDRSASRGCRRCGFESLVPVVARLVVPLW